MIETYILNTYVDDLLLMALTPCHTFLCCRFGNNRGVKVAVEQGGRSGTKFNLFQGSYSNLTDYLVHTMGYTLGKDLFAAPYDWRMHISGGWPAQLGRSEGVPHKLLHEKHTVCIAGMYMCTRTHGRIDNVWPDFAAD